MIEQWKPIPDYEGYFEASDLGRIRSLERKCKNKHGYRLKKGKVLKPSVHWSKYLYVNLWKDNNPIKKLVHVLVISAFRGKKEGKETVDHINFDRQDNRLKNLEYCSLKENIRRYLSVKEKLQAIA